MAKFAVILEVAVFLEADSLEKAEAMALEKYPSSDDVEVEIADSYEEEE